MTRILTFTLALLFFAQATMSQNNGSSLYDESRIHTIELTFFEPGYWQTMQDDYDDMIGGFFTPGTGIKNYVMANMIIDSVAVDSVGVRQKGNFSNWGAPGDKKPFKIDLNEFVSGTKYDGLNKLNLQNGFQDPSMMRDALSYKLMRDAQIPAPRTSYCKVYMNGEYMGLYILAEQVNKDFLENHFTDKSGNLFKCIDNTNMEWQGSSYTEYEDEFELKTNETTNDWTGFVNFIEEINNVNSAFNDSLDSVLFVDSYLQTLAVDVLINNWDSYYDHGRNFYMYENPEDGKFTWIPWDYNLAFSSDEIDLLLTSVQDPKPLNDNIMANPFLKDRYLEKICSSIKYFYQLQFQEDWIDATSELIRPHLDVDPNKFYSITDFDANILDVSDATSTNQFGMSQTDSYPGIKTFFENKTAAVNQELADMGYSCEQLETGVKHRVYLDEFEVYPNPTAGPVIVSLVDYSNTTITVYNSIGEHMLEIRPAAYQSRIDMSNMDAGFYAIMVTSLDKVSFKKVLKQ